MTSDTNNPLQLWVFTL